MATDPTRLRNAAHRNTTPDLASPRLTPAREDRLPGRQRLEIIAGLTLTCWGVVMVAIAVVRALLPEG